MLYYLNHTIAKQCIYYLKVLSNNFLKFDNDQKYVSNLTWKEKGFHPCGSNPSHNLCIIDSICFQ